jgi:CheY-like chemotaxis protein
MAADRKPDGPAALVPRGASDANVAAGAADDGRPAATRRAMVLVVDDDEDFRESLQFVFEADGFEVTTAADGEEAVARLSAAPRPDLILLDLIMPRKNGWQVHDALKADPNWRAIPVVILTGIGLRQGALGDTPVLPKDINTLLVLRRLADSARRMHRS